MKAIDYFKRTSSACALLSMGARRTLGAAVSTCTLAAFASAVGAQCPTYVTQWGSLGSGNGQFDTPIGVATDAVGDVYVVDTNNNRIQKFTATGTYLTQWGSFGSGNGQFDQPLNVATDAAGDVYVTDRFNNRVQKFTGTGAYLTQWGSYGTGSGQFDYPSGVATDAAGNVYVTDSDNFRIQKFTGTGTYLTQWGSLGTGNGQFLDPQFVGTDAAGNVYVTDFANHRVQKFTGTGTYLCQWGSQGNCNGQVNSPVGVATDPAGDVYVVDYGNHRMQKFSLVPTGSCCPPPPNMRAWWPLDEAASPTAADLVNGNNGTHVNGPTPLAGAFVDNSLCFDAGNQYVEVSDDPALNFGTGDLSIDAWIRTTNTSGVRLILDKRADPGTGVVGYEMFLFNGQLGFQLADGNGINTCACDPTRSCTIYGSGVPGFVADGDWHLVAVTVDRDGIGQFWVDCNPVASFDPSCRPGSLDNTSPLRIGALAFGSGLGFDGCIDEVELFDRVLTPCEIQCIWDAGANGKCKPSKCPWDLNGDGVVGFADLLIMLSDWGPCPPPCPPWCRSDFTHDCFVGFADLLELLAHWGPCPQQEFTFSGTVTGIQDPPFDPPFNVVNIGDPWSISYCVDLTAVDLHPPVTLGQYDAIKSYTLTIGSVTVSGSGGPGLGEVRIFDGQPVGVDQFEVFIYLPGPGGGFVWFMQLDDLTGTAFASDSLPSCGSFGLSDFQITDFSLEPVFPSGTMISGPINGKSCAGCN